jgi:hypothetical protein
MGSRVELGAHMPTVQQDLEHALGFANGLGRLTRLNR